MQTKHKLKLLAATLAGGIIAANPLLVEAVPLRLDYTVNPSGGGYAYEFKLTLDNHDGTFVAGQGWSWIIFGDNPSGSSVISDFVVTPGGLSGGTVHHAGKYIRWSQWSKLCTTLERHKFHLLDTVCYG